MTDLTKAILLPVRTIHKDTEIVDADGDLLLISADDSVDMVAIANILNKEQKKEEPTIEVPVSVLVALFNEHDCWAGSMHPDKREEYLSRYAEIRKALNTVLTNLKHVK